MHLDQMVVDLALIMVVAGLVTLVFRKLNISVLLGYIVAGFLVSPEFKLIPTVLETDSIQTWSTIGIVFLMFGLGLEFSFKKLADVGLNAVVTTMTIMCGMILVGIAVGKILGWSHMDCIFLGGMISISSTMVILKSYEEYKLKKESFAVLILGVLLLEDIAGIFMIIILTSISVSQTGSDMAMFLELGLMLLALVAWVVFGVIAIPSFLSKVKKYMNDENLIIVSLAICLGMVVIGSLLGFSEALGAFVAGSILGGTLSGEKIEHLMKPIKDVFGAIFFVSVGMMVKPDILVEYIGPILLIAAVTIVFQMFFATAGILLSGRSLRTAVRGGFSMVQIGEFSFIIASLGANLGVTGEFLYPVIVCVSVITITTTPIFIKNSEKAYSFIDKKIPEGFRIFVRKYTSDRKSGTKKDSDWARYGRRYAVSLSIWTGVLYITYIATKYVGMNIIEMRQDYSYNVFVTLAIVGIMLVEVYILSTEQQTDIFKKLWFKSRTNRLPLITLRAIKLVVAAMFIMKVCRDFMGVSYWILGLAAIVLVYLTTKSAFNSGQKYNLEMRFIANLNEKTIHAWREARGEGDDDDWLSSRLYVVEYSMEYPGELMTVSDLYDNRLYNILVVKIVREGRDIVMPKGTEPLYHGDEIHAMSGKDQLEAYIYQLRKEEHIKDPEEPIVTLKEYIYGQVFREVEPEQQVMSVNIRVIKDGFFDGRTIVESDFRHKYNGYIMCIERGHVPIVDPDPGTLIKEGDMLWVIGAQTMVDRLLKDGLIEGQ